MKTVEKANNPSPMLSGNILQSRPFRVLLLTGFALLQSCLLADEQARDNEKGRTALTKILADLANLNSSKGWMFGIEIENTSPNPTIRPQRGLNFNDVNSLDELGRKISQETDYEASIGNKYFVVCPKSNETKHGPPLTKSAVFNPLAKNASVADFLKSIRDADEKRDLRLSPSFTYTPSAIYDGAISMDAGRGICFEKLNDAARQLKAEYWIVNHFSLVDKNTGEPITPTKMEQGNVSFLMTKVK